MNCQGANFPLLSRGGVDASSRKYREATYPGADGVVLVKDFDLFSQHHPVCAGIMWLRDFFLIRTAPLLG
jgi:hypothetical protein